MTTHPTSTWSESLQQRTREAIRQIPVTPDRQLHVKHPTRGYAYTKVDKVCHCCLLLFSKPGGEKLWFDDVDDLLQAGWAID